jgi:phage-related protein
MNCLDQVNKVIQIYDLHKSNADTTVQQQGVYFARMKMYNYLLHLSMKKG